MPEKIENSKLIIFASLIPFLLVIVLIIIFFIFQKRKSKILKQQEDERIQFQAEINKTKIEIKDQTLKEIGRELHDNIGQLLTVTRIQLVELLREVNHPLVQSLNTITDKTLQEVRQLSKLINTDMVLQHGLIGSLENQKALIEKSGLYSLHIAITGTAFHINHNHELILFRILQEAIANAIKYANHDAFDIYITYAQPYIDIVFKDNGKGFDYNNTTLGNGLTNMKNRANIINTTFTLQSDNTSGTVIQLHYTQHD